MTDADVFITALELCIVVFALSSAALLAVQGKIFSTLVLAIVAVWNAYYFVDQFRHVT